MSRETAGQLDLVIDTTSGQQVARKTARDTVRSAVTTNALTALVGPSGCGKSSLAKQWLAEQGYGLQVWTRTFAWPQPQSGNLGNALGLSGLTHDLGGLFGRVAAPPPHR